MTPEEVLSLPPRVLTQKQREFYFENGYVLLEKLIDEDWLARLRAVTGEMIEESRSIAASDAVWDLEFPGDTSTVPVSIRRLRSKVETAPSRPRHLKTVWGVGYKFEP